VELRWRGALAREEAKWRCGSVMGRVVKVEIIFFIAVVGEKSGGLGRVAYGGGVNLILQFRLKRGGDETKHC
jgi:hypothetical protein